MWIIKGILAMLVGVSAAALFCHMLSPMSTWLVLVAAVVFCLSLRFLLRLLDDEQEERGA